MIFDTAEATITARLAQLEARIVALEAATPYQGTAPATTCPTFCAFVVKRTN